MAAPDTPSLATLPRGHTFRPITFRLSTGDVERYLRAVEDASDVYFEGGRLAWAPPLAAAAFTLKAVMEQARLPEGTLHTGQELDFRCAVPVDADLTATAAIEQRSEMRGMAIAVIAFEVRVGGETALSGRSTVMAPLAGGAGG